MPQTYHQGFATDIPEIRRVGADRPLQWLAAGWQDLRANPMASLSYGLLFAIAGDLILVFALPRPHLFTLAVSVFFLMAPLLATGFYEISRRREQGMTTNFMQSFGGWRRNGQSIAMFGLGLALICVAWERLSAILFALLYKGSGGVGMGIIDFMRTVVVSGDHIGFVFTWFVVGGVLAAVVFALSAISVPMLVDRDNAAGGDIATAVVTSMRAALVNLDAMFLWAMMIVALTLLGFATLLFGLIVIMPLLGHATWHAYRDILGPDSAR